MMDEWIDLRLADLKRGHGRLVSIHGNDIAVFCTSQGVFAVDDSCPHAGSSLASGVVSGTHVRCRAHGLTFDLTTGKAVGGLRTACHEVRLSGDRVLVRIAPSGGT